jgi:hypothetical protein
VPIAGRESNIKSDEQRVVAHTPVAMTNALGPPNENLMKSLIISVTFALLAIQAAFAQTAPEKVSLDKFKNGAGDKDYIEKVKHSLHIKNFLAARDRGDKYAEPLLALLLANGFSIDDFSRAYFVIHAPFVPPVEFMANGMRQAGKSEEYIKAKTEALKATWAEQHRKFMVQFTGVTDKDSSTLS